MSFFPFKPWDVEDKVILGYISRLLGLSLLVLGNYSPRHGPWVLMESGPTHKFSGPTELFHLGKYNLKILHIAEELTILLISSFEDLLEAVFDDMSLFPLKS